jgi:hypothetical protein
VLSSVGILALNSDWEMEEVQHREGPTGDNTQENAQGASTAFDTEDNGGTLTTSVARSRLLTFAISRKLVSKWRAVSAKIKIIYSDFREFNSSLSDRVLRFYPLEFQWDLELAYLLHIAFYTCFSMSGNSMKKGYGWQGFSKAKLDFVLRAFQRSPRRDEADIFLAFYYLPCFIIALHAVLWAVAHSRIVRYVHRMLKTFCHEIDFWLRSGRTIFSIPLSFLLFLPVILQVLVLRSNILNLRNFEATFQMNALARQPNTMEALRLLKDPWSDKLYII